MKKLLIMLAFVLKSLDVLAGSLDNHLPILYNQREIEARNYEYCGELKLLGDDGKCYSCDSELDIPVFNLTPNGKQFVDKICPNRVWSGRVSSLHCNSDTEELIDKKCYSKCNGQRHPKNPKFCCEDNGCYDYYNGVGCNKNLKECYSLL